MAQNKSDINTVEKVGLNAKISDYVALTKFRLAALVVFSAGAGYFMAPGAFDWKVFLFLIFGGFFVTGASNGFNQIIEKDLDKLMNRTKNRPLPAQRLGKGEAIVVSTIFGLLGLSLLWMVNPSACFLGFLALFVYVAIYTPLKTKTPIVVLIGAFPGSVPPLLGYVAGTDTFGLEPGILFLVQFFWQFPHFWAIAWKSNDDYLKAGFKMLPLNEGRGKRNAWLILLFTMFMLPISLLPWAFEMTHGMITIPVACVATLAFILPAFKLYRTSNMKEATKLMFVSFLYLPVVQVAYILDKI